MSTINLEPRPGTAYKKILEERAMLDEFMAMVEKKIEADKRHLDELINLQKSWNPKWNDTGAWSLMFPLLTYFTKEINHRKLAQEDTLSRFNAIPEYTGGADTGKNTFDPLGMSADLEKEYLVCEECRQSSNDPEARQILALAKDRMKTVAWQRVSEFTCQEMVRSIERVEDRAYRVAVNQQHQIVSTVEGWYSTDLEGIVERHQQRAEDIKAFLLGFCGGLGKLASDLSASSSHAMRSTQAIASTQFIAPRHDEIAEERSHLLLQKFEYRNGFDGRIVEPIFGLGPQRILALANQVLDAIGELGGHIRSEIDWVFDLEEQSLADHTLDITAVRPHQGDLYMLLKFTLWSEHPLFPIASRYIDDYPNNVPRKKLRQIVDLIKPELRRGVMALLTRMWVNFNTDDNAYATGARVASHLCHKSEASTIINEIQRKWDFDGDCPLPDGVTRVTLSGSGLVWTKTGRPYVPPTPPGRDMRTKYPVGGEVAVVL